ncbi:MAG: MFS transporter [Chloroflexota bacterium]|nr:MFS transporter [Chloroflexota bacterium]
MLRRLASLFTALESPTYRTLWFNIGLAGVGRWTLTMAIGWLMLLLTHSGFWTGAGMFAMQGPALIGAPLAGYIADISDRRVMLTVSQVITAIALLALAVIVGMQVVTPMSALALALLIGLAFSVQMTGWNALLPSLVRRDRIFNAVALQSTAQRGAELIGPALGSLVMTLWGLPWVFAFCGATYAVAAFQPLALPPSDPQSTRQRGVAASALPQERRWLGAENRAILFLLLLVVCLHCSITMAFMGVLPIFAQMALHGDSNTYGALLSAIGLGSLAATLLGGGVRDARWQGALYGATTVLSGVTLAILGSTHAVAAAIGAALVVGASQALFMTLSLSFIQERVQDAARGRVSSVYTFISAGVMSVANWGYGALAAIFAPGLLLMAGGALFSALGAGLLGLAPELRALMRGSASNAVAPPLVEVSPSAVLADDL